MADATRQLARCAAVLAAAPSDLGAWLDVGLALEDAGRAGEAASAIAELGRAASELGQVALAVACARWLDERDGDAARELTDRIARTHCAESDRIDRSSRPRPPAPPREAPSAASRPDPANLDEAVAAAKDAVERAVRAARERAGDRLPPTPLLSVLGAQDIRALIGVTQLSMRVPGDVILDLGQPAESLYWLARGAASVTRGDEVLGELRAGAFFGEIALLSGTTRTATVTCTSPCWLLEVPAEAVERLATAAPRLATVLAEYARARLLANLMRTSELFSRLSDDERRTVLRRFEPHIARAGDAIVREGADNDRMHVIVSGRCEVRADDELLSELTVGDAFGEASLLRRAPASADVVAVEHTVTLSLSREQFDDVAVAHPELLAEVYKLLVERERQNASIAHDASDLIL